MTGPLPVKGTEISSAPCSVRKAASLLRRFLSSEAASEVGIARGYVEAVAQSLEEILARGKDNGTEGLRLTSGARSSKFFNIESVAKIPEVKKKSQEEIAEIKKKSQEDKESKRKKKVQAMVDFEALLGHELDVAEIGNQADGGLGFEERTEMLPSTPRQVDSVDDGRELQKRDKKKKKRTSLDGAAMYVDLNGMQSSSKAEDSDPDHTNSAKKKKKKRKSLDSAISNGLFDSPGKEIKVETRDEDEDMKPADDVRKKKKKKKHRGDTSQGTTPMTEESKKVLTEHLNSSVGDKESIGNGSIMQQQSRSTSKKSRKRSSELSPGNSDDQQRKSKKLRVSD